ncbi:hypothetical protein MTQ93_09710 [Staphylococcus agnetis]|uniref:hypothetical protein n=1 Tax=Staphylococcus agnetis TaxID=985762 RepID=UPI00208E634A|nr:hypothetical protein [Staphylococcus agnetis]MCO4346320.1 hypothetical protein [Staphylococcus agnetis]MCO4360604.1 hypothetical protein [Staphylococcus agnetis]
MKEKLKPHLPFIYGVLVVIVFVWYFDIQPIRAAQPLLTGDNFNTVKEKAEACEGEEDCADIKQKALALKKDHEAKKQIYYENEKVNSPEYNKHDPRMLKKEIQKASERYTDYYDKHYQVLKLESELERTLIDY